ncbi:DUF4215 domain-containing protein [Sorangium sp. So ce362]|uniref:DUF4215 domain-containing protein n=1 Tax=Sorangium sp. So ce362 TaxID=3133303 RepID=UPI003F5DDECB
MRLGLSLSAVAAMCLSVAACGDDDPSSPGATAGTGGDGGDGGRGGDGGQGGGDDDAQGGDGGSAPEAKADGEACADNEECLGGLCLTEEFFGWAGGYCSSLCDAELLPCAAGSECLPQGSYSLCLTSCGETADCGRAGQTCIDVSGDGWQMCVGGCDADTQCEGACDDDFGFCTATGEACDNAEDDDGDGLQDCEERDCSALRACSEGITAACAEATDVSAGGAFTGTTEDGTNVFGAICSGLGTYAAGGGLKEKVFQFVAPARGVVQIAARSTAPESEFDWYVRTRCDDAATLLGCLVSFAPDAAPVELLVDTGDTHVIFIEALSGADTAYELNVSFVEQVCGDGELVGTEECDDGNAVDDDVCTSACVVNTSFLCANAAALTEAETAGDTSEGTEGFTGSCGGAGKELVVRYTPAASGDVTITATPEGSTDVVLYARTDCTDRDSELACSDDPLDAALPESITVTATAGEPIDIFIDSYGARSSGPFSLTIAPAE